MKIGIDIMGGDFAPEKIIQGAILAKKFLTKDDSIILFGKEKQIISCLKKYRISQNKFQIIHCDEIIAMGEHPTKAFKNKPKSSIVTGFKHLASGEIDSFASAGNTGAMFIGGYYSIKCISGIIRPCIPALLPKENGGVSILLDVGINADCKPDVLYQFGILGSLFAKHVYKIKNPKVALLNLGEEKTKGNLLTQAAYDLMENSTDFKFIGNIEGGDLFGEKSDVIVCDGFTGNIVLKQSEAFYRIVQKRGLEDDYFSKFNYENYGGTPILGLHKPVIVGHGISNEIAIKNMILLAKNMIKNTLSNKIKTTLNNDEK